MSAFFIAMGCLHFRYPTPFVRIVPSFLPYPSGLVGFTGVCELVGGLGILWPRTRRMAAWGLIALLLAVFPANINMALHPEGFRDIPIPSILWWWRLPLQFVMIAWVAWCGDLAYKR